MHSDAWDIAACTMARWLNHPSELTKAGRVPPTHLAFAGAAEFISRHKAKGFPSPKCVILDGEGGIVFEFGRDNYARCCNVMADGEIEYYRFVGERVLERGPTILSEIAKGRL